MAKDEEKRRESKREPALRISPPTPLTHHEFIIDFLDGEPNADFTVRVGGAIAQPYFATLKTDPFGRAQLIWRTGQSGKYDISVETVGKQTGWEGSFEVQEQAGVALDEAVGDKSDGDEERGSVLSVEPPSVLEPENEDTLSLEARVARGEADPEDLGEVDETHLDAAGETQEPVENATISPPEIEREPKRESKTRSKSKPRKGS